MVSVPDVIGMTQADAEAAILAADLLVGTVTTAHSDTVPAGNVISQDPAGGSSVAEGSTVDLVISLGTDMVVVPDLTGMTQASANLVTSGQTPDDFKKTLNGKITFAFTDGAVKGFNLAAMIRKAQAQINGQPPPAETGPNQTDFSEITGTANVTNGIVSNRDLMAKSPLLRVEGTGDVDLPQESLDYLVTAKVVRSLEGQGGKGVTDLKGVEIPVQLSGTFAEPKYKIRLDKALQESAEKKVEKKLGKELEKRGLDSDQVDKLKGLFR